MVYLFDNHIDRKPFVKDTSISNAPVLQHAKR